MGRARDVVEAAFRAWNAGNLDTIVNDYDENAKYWSTAPWSGYMERQRSASTVRAS